jgi:hypothetical protein
VRNQGEFDAAKALIASGQSDSTIAQMTGIPRRTISAWRRGENRRHSPVACAEGTCQGRDLSKLDPEQYSYLLGLYLGDGCLTAGRRNVWLLRISLDAAYPQIIEMCARALETVFPAKTARCKQRPDSRCVDVSMWSKHWPCLFPQHGPGRKHLRSIRLARWQNETVDLGRRAFVRGLIHSDGTRIVAIERKGSYERRAARYAFSNRSEDIKALFCESLDALGIRWTRPSDRQIAIYRKASVALLDEFVGPKR